MAAANSWARGRLISPGCPLWVPSTTSLDRSRLQRAARLVENEARYYDCSNRKATKSGPETGFCLPGTTRCRIFLLAPVINLSCPLQALNGVGQQKTDDLQLETSGRHRLDLPGNQRAQVTENRLDVLASGLAQELFPCSHRPLGALLALGFEVQADLF